mgnify:CR=1 FL=1
MTDVIDRDTAFIIRLWTAVSRYGPALLLFVLLDLVSLARRAAVGAWLAACWAGRRAVDGSLWRAVTAPLNSVFRVCWAENERAIIAMLAPEAVADLSPEQQRGDEPVDSDSEDDRRQQGGNVDNDNESGRHADYPARQEQAQLHSSVSSIAVAASVPASSAAPRSRSAGDGDVGGVARLSRNRGNQGAVGQSRSFGDSCSNSARLGSGLGPRVGSVSLTHLASQSQSDTHFERQVDNNIDQSEDEIIIYRNHSQGDGRNGSVNRRGARFSSALDVEADAANVVAGADGWGGVLWTALPAPPLLRVLRRTLRRCVPRRRIRRARAAVRRAAAAAARAARAQAMAVLMLMLTVTAVATGLALGAVAGVGSAAAGAFSRAISRAAATAFASADSRKASRSGNSLYSDDDTDAGEDYGYFWSWLHATADGSVDCDGNYFYSYQSENIWISTGISNGEQNSRGTGNDSLSRAAATTPLRLPPALTYAESVVGVASDGLSSNAAPSTVANSRSAADSASSLLRGRANVRSASASASTPDISAAEDVDSSSSDGDDSYDGENMFGLATASASASFSLLANESAAALSLPQSRSMPVRAQPLPSTGSVDDSRNQNLQLQSSSSQMSLVDLSFAFSTTVPSAMRRAIAAVRSRNNLEDDMFSVNVPGASEADRGALVRGVVVSVSASAGRSVAELFDLTPPDLDYLARSNANDNGSDSISGAMSSHRAQRNSAGSVGLRARSSGSDSEQSDDVHSQGNLLLGLAATLMGLHRGRDANAGSDAANSGSSSSSEVSESESSNSDSADGSNRGAGYGGRNRRLGLRGGSALSDTDGSNSDAAARVIVRPRRSNGNMGGYYYSDSSGDDSEWLDEDFVFPAVQQHQLQQQHSRERSASAQDLSDSERNERHNNSRNSSDNSSDERSVELEDNRARAHGRSDELSDSSSSGRSSGGRRRQIRLPAHGRGRNVGFNLLRRAPSGADGAREELGFARSHSNSNSSNGSDSGSGSEADGEAAPAAASNSSATASVVTSDDESAVAASAANVSEQPLSSSLANLQDLSDPDLSYAVASVLQQQQQDSQQEQQQEQSQSGAQVQPTNVQVGRAHLSPSMLPPHLIQTQQQRLDSARHSVNSSSSSSDNNVGGNGASNYSAAAAAAIWGHGINVNNLGPNNFGPLESLNPRAGNQLVNDSSSSGSGSASVAVGGGVAVGGSVLVGADSHRYQGSRRQRARAAAVAELPVHVTTRRSVQKLTEGGRDGAGVCGVCLADFGAGEECFVLRCTHRFHVACVGQWLVCKGACPTCRETAFDV